MMLTLSDLLSYGVFPSAAWWPPPGQRPDCGRKEPPAPPCISALSDEFSRKAKKIQLWVCYSSAVYFALCRKIDEI